jgi:hypothetical protein
MDQLISQIKDLRKHQEDDLQQHSEVVVKRQGNKSNWNEDMNKVYGNGKLYYARESTLR